MDRRASSRLSILRFAVIGALGMPVDCGRAVADDASGRWILIPAGLISWLCAATFTWTGNRYFTFRGHGPVALSRTVKEWLRFLAANAVGGLVNVGLYSALVRYCAAALQRPLSSRWSCGVLAGLIFNFTLSKKWCSRDLYEQVIAITGGGAGIGRGIAGHFARLAMASPSSTPIARQAKNRCR